MNKIIITLFLIVFSFSFASALDVTFPTSSSLYNAATFTGIVLSDYSGFTSCEWSTDAQSWNFFTSCSDTSNYLPVDEEWNVLFIRGTNALEEVVNADTYGISFYYDDTPPDAPSISTPQDTSTWNNVTWAGVFYSIDGDAEVCEYSTDGVSYVDVGNACLGYFNYQPVEGSNALYVRGTDGLGNIGNPSYVSFDYYIVPSIQIVYPVDEQTYINTNFLGVNLSYNSEVETCWFLNETENEWIQFTSCENTSNYVPELGTNTLTVKGIGGSYESTEVSITFELTTPPEPEPVCSIFTMAMAYLIPGFMALALLAAGGFILVRFGIQGNNTKIIVISFIIIVIGILFVDGTAGLVKSICS